MSWNVLLFVQILSILHTLHTNQLLSFFKCHISGEKITEVPVESPTFTCAWNPKYHLLAYACDDKDKYNRDRDAGTVKLFGMSNDS